MRHTRRNCKMTKVVLGKQKNEGGSVCVSVFVHGRLQGLGCGENELISPWCTEFFISLPGKYTQHLCTSHLGEMFVCVHTSLFSDFTAFICIFKFIACMHMKLFAASAIGVCVCLEQTLTPRCLCVCGGGCMDNTEDSQSLTYFLLVSCQAKSANPQ